MSDPRITALHSVEIAVPDVAKTAAFFTGAWQLSQVAERGGSVYLRGTGRSQYVIALHPGSAGGAAITRVNLETTDRAAVDALYQKVQAHGASAIDPPADLAGPGGGYGFAFKDVEGRNLGVVADIAGHSDNGDVADRPRKLSHVVLNAGDPEGTVAFFTGVLGFRLSDRTRMLNFLRCNTDHHSIAVANAGGPTLHHMAFEMPDLDSVMRGAGRMREAGWPIDWGVGRHGPGNNVFSYFVGPENLVIEYTAEVEQVDEDYPIGGPEDWAKVMPPGRTDRWGVTDPPSDRLKAAEGSVGFAEALAVPA